MAYELVQGERPLAGIERIAREELRAAVEALDLAGGTGGDEGVHAARKRAKRARALLRLVRSGMAADRRKAEQRRIRDAGREIAELRDARVMLDTLDGVSGQGRPLSAEATAGLQAALEGRYQAARSLALADGVGIHAAGSLLAAAAHAPPWDLEGGMDVIERGLARSARRARKARDRAQEEPTAEHLHTWRKRAKDLRHQVEVLVPAWPPVLSAWAEALHALTDHLGELHDADVLVAVAQDAPGAFPTPAGRRALADLLEHRRAELAAAAFDVGARLHAEAPEAFAGRLTAYLSAWSSAGRGAA